VRVAVDEAGQDGPSTGIEVPIGIRCRGRGSNPRDATAVVDHERRVGDDAERANSDRCVVCDEFADAVDQERHGDSGGSAGTPGKGAGMEKDAGTTAAVDHNGSIAAASALPTSIVVWRPASATAGPAMTAPV